MTQTKSSSDVNVLTKLRAVVKKNKLSRAFTIAGLLILLSGAIAAAVLINRPQDNRPQAGSSSCHSNATCLPKGDPNISCCPGYFETSCSANGVPGISCFDKLPEGQHCTSADMCQSGICLSGVCRSNKCTLGASSCLDKVGGSTCNENGNSGVCTLDQIVNGERSCSCSLDSCTSDLQCAATELCNRGTGKCEPATCYSTYNGSCKPTCASGESIQINGTCPDGVNNICCVTPGGGGTTPTDPPGTGGGSCTGVCIPGIVNNCGEVGRPDAGGACATPGEFCCGDIGGPTPPPVPSCTVEIVQRTEAGAELPNDNGVFRVSFGETITLRARVRNVQNGTVDRVRFIAQEPINVTPSLVVDNESPYDAVFTNTSLDRSEIKVNVRFNGLEEAVCSATVGIRVKSTCDEACNVDTDCLASEGLICSNNKCRLATNPSDATCGNATPTPTPTGAPGVCLAITPNNPTNPGQPPKAGDRITFTCGQVAGALRYRFQLIQPNGQTINLTTSGYARTSNLYTVPSNMYGDFYAQCSVCTHSMNDSSCSPWEPVPGVSTPTPTPTSSPRNVLPTSPISPTGVIIRPSGIITSPRTSPGIIPGPSDPGVVDM